MKSENRLRKRLKLISNNYQLYLFLLPTIVFFAIFAYWPMYGVIIAFKDFSVTKGIMGSPWAGFEHFERFFHSYNFKELISNTLGLSVLGLIVTFPLPIILALSLNQVTNLNFKKFVQTTVYAPFFISTVVLSGMILVFLSPTGIINQLIVHLGGHDPILFMSKPEYFKATYILSDVWQGTGFSAIVYLAALAGVNPEIHEAAIVDGATKWQRILNVDLPSIMPTAIILLILAVGNIMGVGFEKAYLLQTPTNLPSSEIISTYVYKVGLKQSQYSFSAAVGLFNSVINLILLLSVNKAAKKLSSTSLF
ncbi:sugar ABC transporter permease [Paenibacillus sp. PR3]|uniref:Sugar ABC transporter permease n=1 Tax=Paenibacillus terricola TaxID=2763503 RepID=A0ABR8MMB0_9BACL|nr:ABC transporter permease subunit [Paenibacillus terricola]MBD3917162.1 sugar ABC transporter permease [Paenibacillus terricola]